MNLVLTERIRDRLIRYQQKRRRRKLPQASFHTKLAARKRLADRVRRHRGVLSGPIYDLETKMGQKTVAEKAGVHTAEIFQGPFDNLREFDLGSLPERFVVKPTVGSSSNGVFLLEKRDGNLFNIVSGKTYAFDLTCLNSDGLERFAGTPIIAEELIELDGLPTANWKVFAFFGEIGFVRQVDLNAKCYKMWSERGHDLGKIDEHSFPYEADLPAPKDFDALIRAAKAVSLSIATPFVRVDLYEFDKGVSLGEVTLRPGSLWKYKYLQKFTPEWDRKLGEMWEEAEARLVEQIGENYLP
ncbi:ATP-grasp fold amidoligase family protein [Shimia sp. W99]